MDSFTIFGHVYRLCDRYSPIYHAYTFNVRSKSRRVNSVYITSKHRQWKQYRTKVMLNKNKKTNVVACVFLIHLRVDYPTPSHFWIPSLMRALMPCILCSNSFCKGGQILISFIKLLPKNSRNDTFPKVFILI